METVQLTKSQYYLPLYSKCLLTPSVMSGLFASFSLYMCFMSVYSVNSIAEVLEIELSVFHPL